jgi:hypothetical protein
MTTIQINPNELCNKRVLVTGGTKGMGEPNRYVLIFSQPFSNDSFTPQQPQDSHCMKKLEGKIAVWQTL